MYGENVTIMVRGKVPANVRKGIRFSMTFWYDGIPDPIYRMSRHQPHDCTKVAVKPNLSNLIYLSKYQTGEEWAQVICSLIQGQYVNRSVEMAFVFREYGQGEYRSDNLPGSFFTTGLYRMRVMFYDDFDNEFLCAEAKSYVKMTRKQIL